MSFDFFRARILNFSPNVSEIFENLFFVRNQIKPFSGTKKSTPNLETHQNERRNRTQHFKMLQVKQSSSYTNFLCKIQSKLFRLLRDKESIKFLISHREPNLVTERELLARTLTRVSLVAIIRQKQESRASKSRLTIKC